MESETGTGWREGLGPVQVSVHFVGKVSWWEGSYYWTGEINRIFWENIVRLSDRNGKCIRCVPILG